MSYMQELIISAILQTNRHSVVTKEEYMRIAGETVEWSSCCRKQCDSASKD